MEPANKSKVMKKAGTVQVGDLKTASSTDPSDMLSIPDETNAKKRRRGY